METDAIREYLKMLLNVFEENNKSAELQETDDGPVLLCSVESPFEAGKEIGYQFSMMPLEEELLAYEVMMFVFSDIEADKLSGLAPLISAINDRVALGSFRVFEDGGSVMFVQGAVIDETLDVSTVTAMLAKTVGIMENTVANAGEYIHRALKGESVDLLIGGLDREE